MPLPAPWVDHLFGKLAVRWGVAFLRQWQDAEPALVKADWCEVLDGFERHPEAFTYALANLPDKPLNAIQFRALARCAPTPAVAALPEPPADPVRVAKAVRAMQAAKASLRSLRPVRARQSARAPSNGAAEPQWRTEQRERNEAFLGPAAARRTATVIDMEASDATARALG